MTILERLEAIPVHSFHYRLLVVIGLGWMFDAADTGLVSFVLPALAKEWGLTAQEIGYIGSVGLIGMALGAVIAGSIAERLGRRRTFAATLLLYGIATGLCGFAWNFTSLLIFRFFVGFGLGGQLPVAVTLMSEYSPAKERGRFIVLLESFWGAGWLVAALIAYILIPKFGWQAAFFVGALPALYIFCIWRSVPESVRFLLQQGNYEAAHAIVSKLERQAGITPPILSQAELISQNPVARDFSGGGLRFAALWDSRLRRRTLLLWLLWFGIVYSYYGIFTWLPSLLAAQGLAIVKTFEYVLLMTLAQLPGYFAAALLVDRWGRKNTLAAFLLMSGIAAYGFGHSTEVFWVVAWGCTMSFFNLGAWGVVYTYTPELYPTSVRALGVGWAAGIGRIGGMVAPAIVGSMLPLFGIGSIFTMFMAVLAVTGLIVLALGKETKQEQLSEQLADTKA
ncbi:MAG: MFS transporter [Sporomusaceae bacterium]|nr:MFS transporter [Sporomusaceae bacterium]